MTFNDIIVKADYVDGQPIPISFQTTADAPCCCIDRVNPIKCYVNERRTEYGCLLSGGEWAVVTLTIKDGVELWSVDMTWDVTKPPKEKIQENAEQTAVFEQLQKIEENQPDLVGG